MAYWVGKVKGGFPVRQFNTYEEALEYLDTKIFVYDPEGLIFGEYYIDGPEPEDE